MSEFEHMIRKEVEELGGWINSHSHIDRANTMNSKFFNHADMDPWEIVNYPLPVKQSVVGNLHDGEAYKKSSLKLRMSRILNYCIDLKVSVVKSAIDATADIGLTAIEAAMELKESYKGQIDFQVGAYPIFGFKDNRPERKKVFEAAAKVADFIVSLPERDAKPGHIGFREHFRYILNLANELGKDVHLHVDQTNDPSECGTETLIEAARWLKPDVNVWAVHALSVASYPEDRFKRVLDGLNETNIGVIVCPNATISNKQNRKINVPMHNSITRVLDLLLAEVPVAFGSDNIGDYLCPENTPDMYDEIKTAARALRFYNASTWAKLAAGRRINEVDKMKIRKTLET